MLHWYENFLLSNASQITAVESSLRSITYFLPGRFPDSELAGEAIYSALNLLGLYHDSILVRLLSPTPPPRSLTSVAQSRAAAGVPGRPLIASSLRASSGSRAAAGAPAPPATYSTLQHTPSEHARYTHHFSDASLTYSRVARALVIIGYTELLTEMLARRRLGEKKAWDVVVGVEVAKAALRIALLHLTGNRTTVQPPIPEREVDPAMLEEDRKLALAKLAPESEAARPSTRMQLGSGDNDLYAAGSPQQANVWRGPRTGLARPTLSALHQRVHPAPVSPALGAPASAARPRHPLARRSIGDVSSPAAEMSGSGSDSDETLVDSWTEKDVSDYLLSRTLTPNDVKKSEDLVRSIKSGMGLAGEMLWIARPLLYVLALRRWGRKHRTPFFLSFALEWLAGLMRVRGLTPPGAASAPSPLANPLLMAMMGDSSVLNLMAKLTGSGPKEARPISDVEKQEWERRSRAFWWYLLRGPAWHSFTRPKLESFASKTERRPLLGIVGGIVRDYLPLVDDYYYYSST